jgi:hypothetical protein
LKIRRGLMDDGANLRASEGAQRFGNEVLQP